MQYILIPADEFFCRQPKPSKESYPTSQPQQQINEELQTLKTRGPDHVDKDYNKQDPPAEEVLPEPEDAEVDNERSRDEEPPTDATEEPKTIAEEPAVVAENVSKEVPSKASEDMPAKLLNTTAKMSASSFARAKQMYKLLIGLENSAYNLDDDTYLFGDLKISSSENLAKMLKEFTTRRAENAKSVLGMEDFWNLVSKIDNAQVFSGPYYKNKYPTSAGIRQSDRLKNIRLGNPPSLSILKL